MFALLRNLLGTPPSDAARDTYIALVAQARHPFFYESLGVPDTLDGRFELIVLHLYLLQQRLLGRAEEFHRQIGELFFMDMDSSLRELGVADSGVRHRIKAMAKAYHGRLQAYTSATGDPQAMRHASSAISRARLPASRARSLEALPSSARLNTPWRMQATRKRL